MPQSLADLLLMKENQPEVKRLKELWDEPTPLQKMALPSQVPFNLPGVGNVNIPRPPQFQPEPEPMSPDVAKPLAAYMKVAPALQGFIGKVQQGYAPAFGMSIIDHNKIQGSKFTLDDLPNLNINGVTSYEHFPFDIGLNPSLTPNMNADLALEDSLYSTLAHELTHASGKVGEEKPREASSLIKTMLLRNQGFK